MYPDRPQGMQQGHSSLHKSMRHDDGLVVHVPANPFCQSGRLRIWEWTGCRLRSGPSRCRPTGSQTLRAARCGTCWQIWTTCGWKMVRTSPKPMEMSITCRKFQTRSSWMHPLRPTLQLPSMQVSPPGPDRTASCKAS